MNVAVGAPYVVVKEPTAKQLVVLAHETSDRAAPDRFGLAKSVHPVPFHCSIAG